MNNYFNQWVTNTIAEIVDTQDLYWRGSEQKLVPTLALCGVGSCQVFSFGGEQALARFSRLSACVDTVFH